MSSTRFYAGYFARLVRGSSASIAKGMALPLVRHEAVRSGAHEMAYPIGTYAPWQADDDFERVYRAIRRHTLLDIWRLWELWSLLGEVVDVPGALLEVGVWRGGSGALIGTRASSLGIVEPVYLCDTWQGVVKTGAIDIYYRDGKHNDASQATVEGLIEGLGLTNLRLLKGVFPDETGSAIADDSFRLCHIDVDVYRSAHDVFAWAWPRLSSGGLVVFDDYGFPACPGVTQFVNEQRGQRDRLVLHNLNGHGIVVKLQ